MATIKDENKNELKLTGKEERFCYEYVLHLNATKAAKLAGYSEKTADVAGCQLLGKVKVQERIKYLKANLSETAGISALRVLKEHEKIAFADAGQLRDGWMSLKDFENLTDGQKAIIQEVTTKETKYGTEVKLKLFDKQRSLDSINAMLGFDAPKKTELTGADGRPFNPEPLTIEIIDSRDKVIGNDENTNDENIQ